MNKVKEMLSLYSSQLIKDNLSPEKKDDIELRVKLLNYIVSQKYILENYDKVNNELQEYKKKNETVGKVSGKLKRKKKTNKKRTRKNKVSKK